MVTNKLMWSAIISSLSHPCEVSDVLSDVMLDVGVGMLSGIEIIVMVAAGITLEFMVGVTYAEDSLDVPIIVIVPTIDVDMLADENVNGLVAATTCLEFTLSTP